MYNFTGLKEAYERAKSESNYTDNKQDTREKAQAEIYNTKREIELDGAERVRKAKTKGGKIGETGKGNNRG